MKLRSVKFNVLPKLDHPSYFQIERGVLGIFVFADSDDSALDRAQKFVDLLPFERDAGQPSDPNEIPDKAFVRAMSDYVLRYGFGQYLATQEVGSDASSPWQG